MKVVISVGGIFHAFDLAEQLERKNVFERIYTTYPKFKWHSFEVPHKKVTAIRYPEAIYHTRELPMLHRIVTGRWEHRLDRWKSVLFDRAVARKLQPVTDGIFVGFAGKSLQSIEQADGHGFTTVVERSSSHILTQQDILEEERDRFDIDLPPTPQERIDRELEEYSKADFICTPSEFAYRSFLDRGYDKDRVKCVPFGIDVDAYPTRPDGTRDGPFTFLFTGKVSLRKGVQYVLEAWESIELPDARLVFTSPVAREAEPLVAKYADDDSVTFLRWVEDLKEWYQTASVFVFPSLEEGSAIVTYEAMASGLPLITTFNSGWVGTDGEHGIEVPIRDVNAIADAMVTLYENPVLRNQMGASGRSLIEDEYTTSDYGDRAVKAYREML